MGMSFPEKGLSRRDVLGALDDARSQDLKSDGRAFAFVYDAGEEARALAREAFAGCMGINGLDPTVYPSARHIENALVRACLELTGAPEGAVGTATTGGTESVMLAVKAARDHAKKKAPKMLLPETAHACFHKAAHYLGVEVVVVDVDPATMRTSVSDARAKMTDDVILVVGSAPSYAHGVIDPIPELAALAAEHGALMHVDACVGGCVLPFLREVREGGAPVASTPPYDFTVPGVTSMSLDLHKYGYAPKGVSMLVHRARALRDAQYYACATWSGYAVVNTTMLGSKSVAAMGAALATMLHLGKSGYRERARSMWSATETLVAAIERTPGVALVARPDMNLLAFTTERGDVFELADRLTERGWLVQATYAYGRSPRHIHLTIDPTNAENAAHLARDLAACMVDLPDAIEVPPPLVALLAQVGAAEVGSLDAGALMGELGIRDGRLPARAAAIHRLIDAAPPAAREKLLVLFMGELFS